MLLAFLSAFTSSVVLFPSIIPIYLNPSSSKSGDAIVAYFILFFADFKKPSAFFPNEPKLLKNL